MWIRVLNEASLADKKRIAYVRPALWPAANESVLQSLRAQFPDADFDVFTVMELLKKQFPAFVMLNTAIAMLYFGQNILARRMKLNVAFQRTNYFFDYASQMLQEQLRKKAYWFSFQIQSIFNASLPGLPHFVYTDHTHLVNLLYPTFDRRKLLPESWIKREKTIYQDGRLIFTRSSHVTDSVIKQYDISPEKVSCVYYGANVPGSGEQDLAKYSKKNILFVGLDWLRKGGPDLIEAFGIVFNKHPDATLTIVGASPNLNQRNVKVVGRIPIHEMKTYYEQASIFCLPTTLEPSATAFIEAQSYRLPLVVTNIGAAPDFTVNEENGYLVDVHRPDQIANALTRLLDDPKLCEQMGNAGFQRTVERYNWDSVAARMKEHILRSLK
jgi:glycosyltransferase involved in cell wall biosynthesis